MSFRENYKKDVRDIIKQDILICSECYGRGLRNTGVMEVPCLNCNGSGRNLHLVHKGHEEILPYWKKIPKWLMEED